MKKFKFSQIRVSIAYLGSSERQTDPPEEKFDQVQRFSENPPPLPQKILDSDLITR